MERQQYIVLQHHGEWKVLLGQYYGPYVDMAGAIHYATEAARRVERLGGRSEVILSQNGTQEVLWSSDDAPVQLSSQERVLA